MLPIYWKSTMTLMFFSGTEPPPPGLFTRIWNDPVWSKVIGGIITAILIGVSVELWKMWKRNFGRKLVPQVIDVAYNTNLTFPLKVYVEMRNSTKKCIDVHLVEYKKKNISLERFSPRTLQLFFFRWEPRDESVERIAVFPGQRFRAWLGADPNKHSVQQIRDNIGSIGTLTISVDGKKIPIEL